MKKLLLLSIFITTALCRATNPVHATPEDPDHIELRMATLRTLKNCDYAEFCKAAQKLGLSNSHFNENIVFTAALCDDARILKDLVHTYKYDPNTKDTSDRSPLERAAIIGDPAIIDRLVLVAGARVETPCSKNTPLTNAAACYNVDAVKRLIELGAHTHLDLNGNVIELEHFIDSLSSRYAFNVEFYREEIDAIIKLLKDAPTRPSEETPLWDMSKNDQSYREFGNISFGYTTYIREDGTLILIPLVSTEQENKPTDK